MIWRGGSLAERDPNVLRGNNPRYKHPNGERHPSGDVPCDVSTPCLGSLIARNVPFCRWSVPVLIAVQRRLLQLVLVSRKDYPGRRLRKAPQPLLSLRLFKALSLLPLRVSRLSTVPGMSRDCYVIDLPVLGTSYAFRLVPSTMPRSRRKFR